MKNDTILEINLTQETKFPIHSTDKRHERHINAFNEYYQGKKQDTIPPGLYLIAMNKPLFRKPQFEIFTSA